jgi:Fe-S oxidoreductase
MRFDQLNEANPETLAVGCPFCMTQMEDAMKAALDGRKNARARHFRTDRRLNGCSRDQMTLAIRT